MSNVKRQLWSNDVEAFAAACGVDLDPWQMEVINGVGPWIVRCGRQVGKSTAASLKALRTAAVLRDDALVLLVAASERQSVELMAKVQMHQNAARIAAAVPPTKSAVEFPNGSRIVALPGSPATIRGFSAPALVIVDEAAFVDQEVFAAVRPMLATNDGTLLLISTCYLRDDYFDQQWAMEDSYQRVQVRSSECSRISPEFLERERATLPEWLYQREYECVPMESVNLMFGGDVIRDAFRTDIPALGVRW